jgi:hypothetical protein
LRKREDSPPATALASLLHHFAAHIAGILGNIAGRLERNALIRRCGADNVARTMWRGQMWCGRGKIANDDFATQRRTLMSVER